MGSFGIMHLIIVLVIILIFFGPGRLPGLGNSLGKAIRGFKEGLSDSTPTDDEKSKQAREAIPSDKENKS